MSVRNWIVLTALAGTLAALGGCTFLGNLWAPTTTKVRLVNNADFDVEVTIYLDEDQNVLDDLIDDVGSKLTFTLAPGEVQEFTRDCGDLQAIKVDPAALDIIGEIGPEATTAVLRDGSDFNCGDLVTFTFDHSALVTDFDVAIAVTTQR